MFLVHHHNHKKNKHSKRLRIGKKWASILDKIVAAAGLIASMAGVPQLIKIWTEQDVSGVSLLSWSAYTIYSILFTFYGYVHRETTIIVAYGFSIIIYSLIVVGVLAFR